MPVNISNIRGACFIPGLLLCVFLLQASTEVVLCKRLLCDLLQWAVLLFWAGFVVLQLNAFWGTTQSLGQAGYYVWVGSGGPRVWWGGCAH